MLWITGNVDWRPNMCGVVTEALFLFVYLLEFGTNVLETNARCFTSEQKCSPTEAKFAYITEKVPS